MIIIAILFAVFILIVIVAGKVTGSVVNFGVRAAAKQANPKIEIALAQAKKMSNAELARTIRDEEDAQVKEFLKEEFFARGNTKKDLYNY